MTDNDVIKALEAFNGYTIIDIAIKLIKRQKAEIERLESYKNLYEDLKAENLEIIKAIKHCQIEVIREFAERLKESKFDVDVSFGYGRENISEAVSVLEIDNLVKEMTEGADE